MENMSNDRDWYQKATNRDGRGLYAARSLDGILFADTCVQVLANTSLHLCSYCFSENTSRCIGCRTLSYCSQRCQKKDWLSHKRECKTYGQFNSKGKTFPSTVRLAVRLLNTVSPRLMDLESHAEVVMQNTQRWSDICLMSNAIKEYFGNEHSIHDIRRLVCIIQTNALSVNDTYFHIIGTALCAETSFINHSCDPNCVLFFDGNILKLVALRHIAKDEELTISYVENTNPKAWRMKQLRESFLFDCACTKCSGEAADAELDSPVTYGLADDLSNTATVFSRIRELHNIGHNILEQPLPRLYRALVDVFLLTNRTMEAVQTLLLVILRMKSASYKYDDHPLRSAHVLLLARIASAVDRLEECYTIVTWHLLTIAVRRLNERLGPDSPLFKEALDRRLQFDVAIEQMKTIHNIAIENEVRKAYDQINHDIANLISGVLSNQIN